MKYLPPESPLRGVSRMTTQQFDELILAMLVIFILGFFIGNRELKKRCGKCRLLPEKEESNE